MFGETRKTMLALIAPPPPILPSLKSKSLPPNPIIAFQTPNFSSHLALKNPQFPNRKQFRVSAQTNGNNNNNNNNGGNGEGEKMKNERPRLNLRWVDLVLDPDPNNIAAVGLTGLLTWASVQVLWQLFVVSAAILIAAVKYTLVAAILIFILITLL